MKVLYWIFIVITVSSSRSIQSSETIGGQFLGEKTKLEVGSSIMVSVSKDGHFKKHCTVEVGVVYHYSIWNRSNNYTRLAVPYV